VDDDRVSFYNASTRRHTADSEFDLAGVDAFPRVEIVASYAGGSLAPLHALVHEGVDGIVFASPGAGSLSDAEVAAVKAIVASDASPRPVLMRSTRTGNGRVTNRAAFDALGILPTDNLSPQKARILLMLALARTSDPAQIARIFSEY